MVKETDLPDLLAIVETPEGLLQLLDAKDVLAILSLWESTQYSGSRGARRHRSPETSTRPMLIIRILVTVFMTWFWTALMVQGVKQPSSKFRIAHWTVATVACALIMFRTWDCPGMSAACWP